MKLKVKLPLLFLLMFLLIVVSGALYLNTLIADEKSAFLEAVSGPEHMQILLFLFVVAGLIFAWKNSNWKVVGVVQEIMAQPRAYVNQEYFQELTGQKGLGQNIVITTENKDSKNIGPAVSDVVKNLDSAGVDTSTVVKLEDIITWIPANS